MLGQREEIREYQERYRYFVLFLMGAFLIIFLRIWYLQILNGDKFYIYSKENSLKQEKIPAPRGKILDRNREILVDSEPSFDITWTPQFVTKTAQTKQYLSKLIDMTEADIDQILLRDKVLPGFHPRIIKQDVSRDDVAKVEANLFDMPGIEVGVAIKRIYRDREMGSHLYGYIGETNADELDRLNRLSFEKYYMGDFIGKFGIEERYEEYLRGIDGAQYAEVDAFGRKKSTAGVLFDYDQLKRDPIAGKNLVLTIDRNLQQKAAEFFKGKVGAVIALDPRTGEILAMHSQPGFNPTDFSRGIDPEIWNGLISNPDKPLLDKTIQDSFPPGSTFKTITALAGLEENVIPPQEVINCNGHYYLGRGHYRCWTWRDGGHGQVNMHRAIKESCDAYFYRLGVALGVDRIAKYATLLGLSRKTGLNLKGEVSGTIPSEAWKKKRFGEKWYPGETPSIAIGQGYVTVTALQLAKSYAAIANGGKLYLPHVVKRIEETNGELLHQFESQLTRISKISPRTLKILKDGLYAVVNEPGGTAYWSARWDGLDIAGKTGTAQVIRIQKGDREKKCEQLEFKYRDHGWFVGFAPVDDPKIVVVVLALHDCHPYSGATTVVRNMIREYLKDKVNPSKIRFKPKHPKQETIPHA